MSASVKIDFGLAVGSCGAAAAQVAANPWFLSSHCLVRLEDLGSWWNAKAHVIYPSKAARGWVHVVMDIGNARGDALTRANIFAPSIMPSIAAVWAAREDMAIEHAISGQGLRFDDLKARVHARLASVVGRENPAERLVQLPTVNGRWQTQGEMILWRVHASGAARSVAKASFASVNRSWDVRQDLQNMQNRDAAVCARLGDGREAQHGCYAIKFDPPVDDTFTAFGREGAVPTVFTVACS